MNFKVGDKVKCIASYANRSTGLDWYKKGQVLTIKKVESDGALRFEEYPSGSFCLEWDECKTKSGKSHFKKVKAPFKRDERVKVYGVGLHHGGISGDASSERKGIIIQPAESSDEGNFVSVELDAGSRCVFHVKQCRKLKKKTNE